MQRAHIHGGVDDRLAIRFVARLRGGEVRFVARQVALGLLPISVRLFQLAHKIGARRRRKEQQNRPPSPTVPVHRQPLF